MSFPAIAEFRTPDGTPIPDEILPPRRRPVGRPRHADDPHEQSKHIRCLVYRVHDGKTVAEVAEIMGVSARTVKTWTRLALDYYHAPEVKVIRKSMPALLPVAS